MSERKYYIFRWKQFIILYIQVPIWQTFVQRSIAKPAMSLFYLCQNCTSFQVMLKAPVPLLVV